MGLINVLQQLFDEAGYGTRSYSGRGMGGKECLGVVLNQGQSLGSLFGDVIETINTFYIEAGNDGDLSVSDVADAFDSMQTDSMGKGTIVYFPGYEYFNLDEDDIDDEDTGDKEG
jgi:hypothetical protein